MPDIQNYGDFLLAILLFQLLPGPGTFTLLALSARAGRAAGLSAIPGMLLGDLVYMVAALAGLAALMQTLPLLFGALQWIGAGYLCWLGLDLLRSPPQAGAAEAGQGRLPTRSFFRRGLFVSLTNPKVALFFMVFFPLFMKPDAGITTLVAMVLHVSLFSLVYQLLLVLAGSMVAARLRDRPLIGLVCLRMAGLALLGFGLRLALANAQTAGVLAG